MREIPEIEARRVLSGAPITLVTSVWRGKPNVMPVAYCMPLSLEPPLVGIAVHPERHSYDVISHGEEFVINVPSRRLLHFIPYLGSVSGRDMNKFEVLHLPIMRGRYADAPLIEGCLAHLECSVESAQQFGDHVLFIGRPVAIQADEQAFDDHWLLSDDDAKPLQYLGGSYFSVLDTLLEAKMPRPLADPAADILEASTEHDEQWKEEEERRRREGRSE